MKKILLIIFLLPFLGFSQVTGDYRSIATGNWTTLTSWEYYNGTGWVAATATQGYPGQNAGTGAVTIRDSHTITINTNITNSFGSLLIGNGSNAVLVVAANVYVSTTSVSINSNASMLFDKNMEIKFPENISFVINALGKVGVSDNCTNNNAIYFGSVKYSTCNGGGNAITTFDQLNKSGGTGSATSNSPVCAGNQLVLTAIPPVATSGSYTYTYQWFGPGIYNPSFNSSPIYTIDDVNIYNHGGRTYKVEIKRNDGVVSTVSTNVVVNPAIAAPTNTRSDNVNWCTATIRWDGAATNFNLDVATSNTFSAGSILSSYNNLNVGSVKDLILSGLLPNTTYYFRVRSSGNCASSDNSPVHSFTTMTIAAPTANSGYVSCNDWIAQWNGVYNVSGQEVDGYYLDVAIDNTFTNYVSGYQNLYVDKASNRNYTLTGLTPGGVYYYRLRAKTACGTGGNSNVISFTLTGNGSSTPGNIGGGALSICIGNTTTFTILGSNPNNGQWSVFNQTGSATITQAGVVTGVSVGAVKVVYTTYSGSCGTSTSKDLTITAGGTVGVASSNPVVCVITAINPVTHTTSGFTGISNNGVAGANGLPAGVSATFVSNTITISGTPTVSGIFNYSISLIGGCPGVNATGTITVNDLPSKPTNGTITQPTCAVPTGSFTITNYNALYIYTFSPSTGVIVNGDKVTAPSGTYTFTATSGSCSSTASSNVVINNPPSAKTWNGTSWSPVGNPTIENPIIFTGNYSSSSNVVGCSCQVKNGAQVIINSAHTLTVTNSVDVVSGSTLTFENNASLVQTKDAAENVNTNSGNIIYKRHTDFVRRYDFTYWSSPVVGEKLYNVSPTTLGDKFYGFNANINNWEIYYNGNKVMESGEGYLIRAPQSFDITVPAIDINPKFTGKPNNGVITKTLAAGKLYLLGNPYPSALDADQFLDKNSTVLAGTLYFWTHNTAIQLASNITNGTAGSGVYAYTSDDYASYNRTGGVGTGKAASSETGTAADVLKNTPTGKIASGQGFFVYASTTGGKVEYNNGMRVSGNNTQFFKLNTTSKTTTTIEKNRVWLNMTNKQGAFKQALIGYITGATNDYEGSFDGVSFDGNTFLDFYSINQKTNLSIQGRALPFQKKDSVALGYKSAIKGEFQISIDATDGVLASQNIFVEDQDLKVLHDLKKEPYTFSTEVGTFNNRFVLRYVDKNVVEIIPEPEAPEVLYKDVLVSVQNGQVKVNSPVELIDKVILYDMVGRKIYQKNKVAANELVIPHLLSSNQVLLVDILLSNGTKLSRKIVY